MSLSRMVGKEFKDEELQAPAHQDYYDHCAQNGNEDIKKMLHDYAAAYETAKEFTVR